ncbi:MAG: hypothetical protein V4635_11785 [Bacteroidota bacterium]
MKQIVIAAIIVVLTACSESPGIQAESQIIESDEKQVFVLPDSINVKKELVIAAYKEIHPKNAFVVFAYDDTLRTSARKYSYSNDSTFFVSELIIVNYSEYKMKNDPNETYIVKPGSVVWMHQNGTTAMSSEYERIDQDR